VSRSIAAIAGLCLAGAKASDAVLEFVAGETGQVTHLVLHQNGQRMTGVRKR